MSLCVCVSALVYKDGREFEDMANAIDNYLVLFFLLTCNSINVTDLFFVLFLFYCLLI
jgi:hypothetical protein